jgi:shikimate kinase
VKVGVRPVVVIGLMGAGKSTVGRALARAWGVPFVDNDELLRARDGRTARAIAADDGVAALHRAEAAVARSALMDPTPRVVTLAASVADDVSVLDELRGRDVVWLRASPSTLHARVDGRAAHRPSAHDLGETVEQQAARRAAAFGSVARVVVDVDDRQPAAIVEEITAALQEPGG